MTPVSFVEAIIEAYRQRGMDWAHALEQAQIPTVLLHEPGARITALQMEHISSVAMRELDDEGLGWFGRRLPWGSYGMLARASITAPTLERALKRWCRHHGLLTQDITLQVEMQGAGTTISILEQRPLGVFREFCLVSMLRNLHGLACWMVDAGLPLQAIGFPFDRPAHHDVYPLLFPGPTAFGCEHAFMRFDTRLLAQPLRRDEAALQNMLQHALPLTVMPYRRERMLAQRVRHALSDPSTPIHNADSVAGLLNLSSRTLHRRLREEGTSLQALKDEVRLAHATALLQRSSRSVKQIAEAVGFRNEKSFIRAFHQWTGHAPVAFRKLAR